MKKENNKEYEELLTERLKGVSNLSALYSTEGGKFLAETISKDVASIVDTLASQYKTLTHQEMVGLCASMATKRDIVQVLVTSEANKKQARKELEDLQLDIQKEDDLKTVLP